ncbi:MAG: hypothetical protein KJN71_09380 [Acidimicrobiia bacterium]|nr:hypothetical protein [Acidimicrobiia bacterium]
MDSVIVLPDVWVPVVAAFIPLLTAFAVKREGSNAMRALFAAIAVVVLSVVEQITANDFTLEGLVSTGLIAAVTQATWYVTVYKPLLNVNERAPDTVSFL